MLKELISYTDFDGNERQEYHYFNFTESEIQEMDLRTPGGLKARLDKIVREQDSNQLVTYFKGLILDSYGVKSDDGRRFIKSKELSEEFSQTGAYNKLFTQLIMDTNEAIRFVNGIIPDVKKPEDNIKPVGLPSPESVAASQKFSIPEMPNA